MFCFAKFCRLCLKDSSALINIFNHDKDDEKIVDKMKFILPELISPLDGLPPWVCPSCRTQVNRSHNLYNKWIKSREILQQYIRKLTVTNQVPNSVLNIELENHNFKLDKVDKIVYVDQEIIATEKFCGNKDFNVHIPDEHKQILYDCNTDRIDKLENSKIVKLVQKENKTIVEIDMDGDKQIDYSTDNEISSMLIPSRISENQCLNRKSEEIALSNNKEEQHIISSDNTILTLGTENKVIDELLEIVKLSENIQNEQFKYKGENFVCDNRIVNNFIHTIEEDKFQVDTSSIDSQIHVLKSIEEVSVNNNNVASIISNGAEPSFNSSVSSNIYLADPFQIKNIENTIQINQILVSNEKLQQETEDTMFLSNSSGNLKRNIYVPETTTQNCSSLYSQIPNDLQFSESYSNANFLHNVTENNCQYLNYNANEVSGNNTYSLGFDVVKKISGYLQESYPASPANVYCNLDDNAYNKNYGTIMDTILEKTTKNSTPSPISALNNEEINIDTTKNNKFINTKQQYYSYSTAEINPNSDVQTSIVNNSWNPFSIDQELLAKENFTLLENVENNLESLLHKNDIIQNQASYTPLNYYSNHNNTPNANISGEIIMPYSPNFSVDSNIYNTEFVSSPMSMNGSTSISTDYAISCNENSPTIKLDCFTFSEDSNGNEIPSRNAKVIRKRNKTAHYKENKFYQIFQDMEIASRHCNTPIEFSLTVDNTQITYLVDKSNSLYYCKTCNITYSSVSQILDHGSSLHNSSGDLKENEYLSVNVEKPDKSVKLIVNHEIKKFICKKCDKNFGEVAALYRHVAVHVSNQRYFCDECGKSFPVYRYLSLHKLIHSRIKVYACKLCPKTFRAKDTLKTHEIVHHESNQNKPFVCEVCGKGFIIEQYLKIHMKRHNQETGRICHICGKILRNEEHCQKHIKEKHLVVSLKECEICHKTFHANRNLKAHMKLHGTRDFKCDQCDKEFFFKRDLKNHQLLHTGFRPHICHLCGKDFRSLGALYKHVRTHTIVKPFVCSICQKAFSQLKSLQVHEKVHSGQKPYKCQECGKSYVQNRVFQQHMKKIHPDAVSSSILIN